MTREKHPTVRAEKTALRIAVFSDVVCPWCFIGKRRLDKAIRAVNGHDEPCIIWHPFQLNPTMPRTGMDRKAYLDLKFGGPAARASLEARVAAVGKSEGIPFAFERIQRSPNTFDAHRLIWFAQREGCQDPVVEALFRSYFMEGQDIGDRGALVGIAGRAGLDQGRVERFLESDEGAAAVLEEEEKGRDLGITGVPHFVINDTFAVSGAQTADTLASVFEQALKRTQ